MERIPVTFEHNEKTFTGHLGKVMGAGSGSVWYLMDDKDFYKGRLRKHNDQWVFDSSKDDLSELAEYLGDYVIAWMQ